MSDNLVEMLREKTEELDLDHTLKSCVGGYTKKSVLEYLAQLKRQQQNTTNSFNRDLQATLDEKEKLQGENETLKKRVLKAETDYRSLSESVAGYRVENSELTMQDVMQLRSSLSLLEKDMDEAVARIRQDEQEQEHRRQELEERDRRLEKAAQELKLYQEMTVSARNESEGLRRTVSGQAAEITQLQGEVRYLKGIVSEGSVAELNNRITELMGDLERQQAELEARNKELESRGARLNLLEQKGEADRRIISQLQASLDGSTEQNEKLAAAEQELAGQLEEQLRRNVALLREAADLRVEKAILLRKLDAERLHRQLEEFVPDAPGEKP